jgi:mannose/fructose-specific phosphotransferase system component IIA
MKTGIILVSHGDSGLFMLEAAEKMVGKLDARIVAVPFAEPREQTEKRLEGACGDLDVDEFLFLVDLEGSTPFNLCCRRCGGSSVVLTGVNMPMLFKLSTVDRNKSAIEIAEELRQTGQKSIHIRPGAGTRES